LKIIDRGLVYRAFLTIALAIALIVSGSAAAAPNGGVGLVEDGAGIATSKQARPADA